MAVAFLGSKTYDVGGGWGPKAKAGWQLGRRGLTQEPPPLSDQLLASLGSSAWVAVTEDRMDWQKAGVGSMQVLPSRYCHDRALVLWLTLVGSMPAVHHAGANF